MADILVGRGVRRPAPTLFDLIAGPATAAQSALGAMGSAAKGAAQATVGLPGDIESLVRMLTGGEQQLPTTEQVGQFVNQYIRAPYPQYERLGEFTGLPTAAVLNRPVTQLTNEAADAIVRAITRNPEATAQRVIQETSMPFMQAVAPKIVKPGDKVSGLTVREEVPNVGSISASLDNYEILSGIREVPRGAFDKDYLDSLSFENLDKRTKELARQIQGSKEINPMIVGVDSKGAYIIEGGHRFDALMAQNTKSIPAMVVIDKSDPPSETILKSLLD